MKKLLTVAIIVLFLGVAIAPSINANEIDTTEVFDRVSIGGVLFFPQFSENNITCFVIRFSWYNQSTGEIETYRFQWITIDLTRVKNDIGSFYTLVKLGLGLGFIVLIVGVVKNFETYEDR